MWSFFHWYRRCFTSPASRQTIRRGRTMRGRRPLLEKLEDRCVPASITASFNATAVAAGNTIWFESIANSVSGVGSSPATIHVTNQTISFTDSLAGTINVSLPNTDLTLTPGGTSATTTFDTTNGKWSSNDPTGLSG